MQTELPPLLLGTLDLVATPIGNLEDITLRAPRSSRPCGVMFPPPLSRRGGA